MRRVVFQTTEEGGPRRGWHVDMDVAALDGKLPIQFAREEVARLREQEGVHYKLDKASVRLVRPIPEDDEGRPRANPSLRAEASATLSAEQIERACELTAEALAGDGRVEVDEIEAIARELGVGYYDVNSWIANERDRDEVREDNGLEPEPGKQVVRLLRHLDREPDEKVRAVLEAEIEDMIAAAEDLA